MVFEQESNKVELCLEVEEPRAENDLHVNWSQQVISQRSEFLKVLRSGRMYKIGGSVFYIKVNNLPYARLGISVRKANLKLAVTRNRSKRLQRAVFQEQSVHLVGFDILVLPFRVQSFTEVGQAFAELCQLLHKV